MKKCLVGLIGIITFVACFFGVVAASPHFHPGPPGKHGPDERQLNADAWYVISRTWTVLENAKKIGGENNHFFDLGQDYLTRARTFYMNHVYRDAIFHALRARKFLFRAIEESGESPQPYYYPDERERYYIREGRLEGEF